MQLGFVILREVFGVLDGISQLGVLGFHKIAQRFFSSQRFFDVDVVEITVVDGLCCESNRRKGEIDSMARFAGGFVGCVTGGQSQVKCCRCIGYRCAALCHGLIKYYGGYDISEAVLSAF